LVALQVRALGLDAKAYTSYNFVKGPGCPSGMTVEEQMAAAADDAVDLLVVVNQNGAQNSNSTIGVVYDDIMTYLASPAGAKWNTTIIGARLFFLILSCTFVFRFPRYPTDMILIFVNRNQRLLAKCRVPGPGQEPHHGVYCGACEGFCAHITALQEALASFPDSPSPAPSDTCIMFACHGNPQSLTKTGQLNCGDA
jgi:hypothetical protein